MTRIIAIVVVILAAVLAYMYTSAGDVEIGEAPTSTEPAAEGEVEDSASPDDAAAVTNPAQEEEAQAGNAEETAAEEAEGETTEAAPAAEAGETEAIEGEAAPEADVTADTSETVPAEEGPADEEPDAGVGAVSTEEETDGAGTEGITAEEGEQAGLEGDVSGDAAATDTGSLVAAGMRSGWRARPSSRQVRTLSSASTSARSTTVSSRSFTPCSLAAAWMRDGSPNSRGATRPSA